MNSYKISRLSDDQLIALYRSPNTDKVLKKLIVSELDKRDLEASKETIIEQNVTFTTRQKLLFVCTPFLHRSHRQTIFKKHWNRTLEKKFWKYITLGILLYLILFFIGLTLFR